MGRGQIIELDWGLLTNGGLRDNGRLAGLTTARIPGTITPLGEATMRSCIRKRWRGIGLISAITIMPQVADATATKWVSAQHRTPPTVIMTVADLQNIANNLSGNYVLGADIDAAGYPFTPIGPSGAPFLGTFDGAGHSIKNLTISWTGAGNVGLFGTIGKGAVVQDVALTNASVAANFQNQSVQGMVGTIAGEYLGALQDVSASGSVTVSGGAPGAGVSVGGLAGSDMDAGTLAFSHSSASVIIVADGGVYSAIGGLVGFSGGTISDSWSIGRVTNGAFSFYGVGGLVGYDNSGQILRSYATGNVLSGQTYHGAGGLAGGVIGASRGNNVIEDFASGSVNGSSFTGIGGLIGFDDEGSVQQSYATGWATGTGITTAITVDGQTYYPSNLVPGAGGLIGVKYGGYVDYAAFSSGVVAMTNGQAGGLIGWTNDSSAFFQNTYWDTITSQTNVSAGGTGEPTSYLQTPFPSGFDPEIWSISPKQSYPFLVPPMSQLRPSSYNSALDRVFKGDKQITCVATVFAIIARSLGLTMTPRTAKQHGLQNKLLAMNIDDFWESDSAGASWWTQLVSDPNSVLWTSVVYIGPNGEVGKGQSIDFTTSMAGTINGSTIANWLATGQLAIIEMISVDSKGNVTPHSVLATGLDSSKLLVAIDPWTGTRIKIDPLSWTVTSILDPRTNVFYLEGDLINCFRGINCTLAQGIIDDFNTWVPYRNGTPSYVAVKNFTAENSKCIAAGQNCGWVEAEIK